jgi:hypothetical protein
MRSSGFLLSNSPNKATIDYSRNTDFLNYFFQNKSENIRRSGPLALSWYAS